jgi:transglutaminase-like putative cysteine protease
MKYDQQVPRNALVWIILSQFVLLLPHITRIPTWVIVVFLLTAWSRSMVYQGRWSFPGNKFKAALAITCFAGVFYSYRSLIGLEPTVALLLAAFALKLVELSSRKDAYLLIFLGYFVCVTEFLFNQEILTVLYMLFAVVVLTTALVALHQPGEDAFNRNTFKRAALMLAQAFPLMLVLFFVFPRIGPLWSVPLKSHAAKSGVSDFMSPGDISELSLSDEVAFRVQFDGEIPPRSQLYWRGLVFSKLQSDEWRSLRWREVPVAERRQHKPLLGGSFFDYSIILEPTQQNWLYALRYANTRDRGILSTNDFRLVSPTEIQDQRRYQVRSYPQVPLELQLSSWRRKVDTELGPYSNPRTRELAQAMFAQTGGDTASFVNAILAMFQQQEFYYTLKPPLLGSNAMDDFLFRSRRGFCEHYAAALAVLVRAAGIPARVVAGYQGGEINPVNGTVVVHQFDAHAWNEVWYEGRGWVRVDPTGAIAPDRIEYGLEQALAVEGSFLQDSPLSPLRYRNIDWLNNLRLQLDAINYSWQAFVLTYDTERQYQFLNRFLGEISVPRIALLLLGCWALVLIPVALGLLRASTNRRVDEATRVYQLFCKKLQRARLQRAPQEAPLAFANRVIDERPDLAADVRAITALYDAISYRSKNSPEGLLLLRKQVGRFKPKPLPRS